MLYRKVPKNGDELSTLGYGCMRLPGTLLGIDEDRAVRQIRSAIDAGVNYVDTAWPYHGGKSEGVVGRALRDGYRDRVKVADKLPHWMCRSAADMTAKLDIQLRRLGVDVIDYYLIHAIDGESWRRCKEHGVLEFLERALASGKILNAGFSFHGPPAHFAPIVDDHDWTFCQIQYNILDEHHQAGRAGLEYAAGKGLAVIVMEPLRGGALATGLPKEVQALYDRAQVRRSPVEWALAWILDHPGVTCVLSGMNDDEHIRQNLAVADASPPGCLSPDERALVAQVAAAYRRLQRIPCTSCQYCMPCPAGVDIPRVFGGYNAKYLGTDGNAWFHHLVQLGGLLGKKPGLARQCTRCGACVPKCPQSIAIPDELARVRAEFEGPLSRLLLRVARLFFG